MTDTIESVTEMAAQGVEVGRAEGQEIAHRLGDQARAEGVELIGPGLEDC